MADLLGFAYKVIVIVLIVAAIVAAIAAASVIINAVAPAGTNLNDDMKTGYEYGAGGAHYGPLTWIEPMFAAFQWNDSFGSSFDAWGLLKTLAAAIPSLIIALLAVRWLIRAAK